MATYTKVKLSGTNAANRPKSVVSDTWTTVHTTGSGSTTFDEIWLWVGNPNNSEDIRITIRTSDGSTSDNFTSLIIPANSNYLVLSGIPMSGDGTNTTLIQVYHLGTGNLFAYGYVNRITP